MCSNILVCSASLPEPKKTVSESRVGFQENTDALKVVRLNSFKPSSSSPPLLVPLLVLC